MRNIQVLDRQYNILAFMTNEAENGLHYTKDKLKTSIDGGIYTLDFEAPKTTSDIKHLKEGHYITFINDQDMRLMMEIKNITEDRMQKTIHCQDVNINLINPYADPSLAPNAPQTIDYYLNHAISKTGWEIGKQEFTETMTLEYTNDQSILERIRDICKQYGAEFYFSVGEFESGKSPNFYINVVKKRLEGDEGFRISSDDYVQGIQRRVNNDGVVTKMRVRGKAIEEETEETPSGGTGGATGGITQSTATQYDQSKASGATSVSTSGWSESEVNQFKLDANDPPYVTGAYIDAFLRKYYSDSPLIGQGALIKEMADYWGVSVGAFMGVIAKETTFGRGEPGKSNHNYGCIRWTSGSGFPAVNYGGSAWNSYPNARTGIVAWFKLIRWSYLEPGAPYYSRNYKEMLDFYSPTSDGNNQATFKNLMWGVLKSFGYNMSATAVKKNYSKSSDNALNFQVPSGGSVPEVPNISDPRHAFVEKAIARGFELQKLRLPYVWGGNSASRGMDCSGSMQEIFRHAGVTPNHRWTTYSMWGNTGGQFKRISKSELKRGDCIMYDTKYTTSRPNHVGVFIGNNQVMHTGDPNFIVQRADSMEIVGYVRVLMPSEY